MKNDKKLLENWEQAFGETWSWVDSVEGEIDYTPTEELRQEIKLLLAAQRRVVERETVDKLVEEIIELSDTIELSEDTNVREWMAFKRFRNTLRDRYLKS